MEGVPTSHLPQERKRGPAASALFICNLQTNYSIKLNKKKGRRLMSWTGWVVIGIIGVNVVGFGLLALWFYAVERRRRR